MIILQNDDLTLEQNSKGEYAVFLRVWYKCGAIAYWQQVCKWYKYKKKNMPLIITTVKGKIITPRPSWRVFFRKDDTHCESHGIRPAGRFTGYVKPY